MGCEYLGQGYKSVTTLLSRLNRSKKFSLVLRTETI